MERQTKTFNLIITITITILLIIPIVALFNKREILAPDH